MPRTRPNSYPCCQGDPMGKGVLSLAPPPSPRAGTPGAGKEHTQPGKVQLASFSQHSPCLQPGAELPAGPVLAGGRGDDGQARWV